MVSSEVALSIGAFIFQTLVVYAGNSRLFGLLKPGSGWFTNVELSERYASLVTPARWAFAIWGLIYIWETIAMVYLAFNPTVAPWDPTLKLWLAANACQALWAPLFATERLALSAVALSGIAVSLVGLGLSLPAATTLDYFLFAAPMWLHAGWTVAASIVNVNLVIGPVSGASAAVQLAAATLSAFVAVLVGLSVVALTPAPLTPLPLAAALTWALAAIRAELVSPDLIKTSEAYAQIGEIARRALELAIGWLAIAFACAATTIAIGRWASTST